MRYPHAVAYERRLLCVFPAYTPSFGTFAHAYALMWRVRAFMPPQGLLVIAAYLPARWSVRFVDENIARARATDFEWADAVLVSGMHVQGPQIREVHARANAAGKVTVLGGPSVSAAPEKYPEFDYLHVGEIGDATDRLIECLDSCIAPPPLWDRLERAGRLAADPSLESNVRFLRPYDEVVARWRQAIAYAYAPENLFARFLHQVRWTHPHRLPTPAKSRLTFANLRRAVFLAGNIVWRLGILAHYRSEFWRAARYAVRQGQIESVFGMGFVAYHLIRFTREALRGEHNASFYAERARRQRQGDPMRALRASAAMLVASACFAGAALAQGVGVRVLNDTPNSLYITLKDLNSRPPENVLSGQVINGNAAVNLSVTADASGRGLLSWSATTVDRDMRRCARRRKVSVNDGATVHVFANRHCHRH
jgi:hypothetical protein